MNIVTVLLSLLLLISCVDAIKWVNCSGSLKGAVKTVSVSGCETTPVCSLVRGTNASIEIDFIPSEDSATAKSVVHGIVAGVPIPFPLPNPDVCKDSGISCPLKNGNLYNYKTTIYVSTDYPKLSVKVKWEVEDAGSNDMVCVEIAAKITDPPKFSHKNNVVMKRGKL